MQKQHFLCLLTSVLSIVPRTVPTLELKLSLINVFTICMNEASSKSVTARGVARVRWWQKKTVALVFVLIIVIPSTVTLSA